MTLWCSARSHVSLQSGCAARRGGIFWRFPSSMLQQANRRRSSREKEAAGGLVMTALRADKARSPRQRELLRVGAKTAARTTIIQRFPVIAETGVSHAVRSELLAYHARRHAGIRE